MNRRELLEHFGGVLALSMAPLLPACATVGGPDLQAMAGMPVPHLADQLRARMSTIRETTRFPLLADWIEQRGQDRELLGEVVATLWVSTTFRDLPRDVRIQPEIQRWLLDEGPTMARSMYQVAELLEGLSAAEREELVDVLTTRPEIVQAMTEGFDVHASSAGVEPERRRQSRTLLDHTTWRLRHQSPDAVIDELLHRFDRVCRRNGVERKDWRRGLAAELPLWRSLEPVGDPEGRLVEHVAESVDPDELIVPLDTRGTHLGFTLRHQGRAPVVEHVVSGSPAAAAGLRVGDAIVGVDGRSLDAPELIGWLSMRAPGDRVALEVRRDRERLVLLADLGTGPGDRMLLDRPGTGRSRLAYTSSGISIAGGGLIVMALGMGTFVVGTLIMAAGGGALDGVGGAGAVLTVVGVLLLILGLLIVIVGAIASGGGGGRSYEEERWIDEDEELEDADEDEE
ncbi:MAG: PDZ domain-containing protein [Alphaproteobacteria bacterium]|nr:PDZ domain-containing protein [Alphaproteobacteria bacterium]